MALNQTLERHSLRTFIQHHSLIVYFGLTYLFTWSCWFALLIFLPSAFQIGSSAGASHRSLLIFLYPLGNIVPSIVGIILTRIVAGRGSVHALFGQVVRWRVNPGWYGVALFLPPLVTAGALALTVALGGSTPALSIEAIAGGLVGTLLAPLGEELGWRGFALPRLQVRRTALGASIVLGLLWGTWHVPIWIAGTSAAPALLIPALALQVLTLTAFAVLITWVFNNTGGSLLLTMLFHASITVTSYYPFPKPALTAAGWEQTLLYLALLWAVVLMVVVIYGPRRMMRSRTSDHIPPVIDAQDAADA